MEISQEKRDEYIKRITEIAQSIKSIYDNLIKEIDNEEKTKELLEYLELATSVEDKVYKEIGEELLSEDRFMRRIIYLIQRSDLKDKALIENRIINYIVQTTYANPFLSREKYKKTYDEDNTMIIKSQITIDYIKAIILNTEIELNKATTKKERTRLAKAKYTSEFQNKFIASLLKDQKNHKLNGRERCIVFGHDEDTVKKMFSNHSIQNINYDIYAILCKDNNIFEQIQLKSSLQMLEKEEVNMIAYSYYKSTTTNPQFIDLANNNPNHEIILNIISEMMEEKGKIRQPKK